MRNSPMQVGWKCFLLLVSEDVTQGMEHMKEGCLANAMLSKDCDIGGKVLSTCI